MKKKWRYFVVIGKEGKLINLPELETEEEVKRRRKLWLRRKRREILKGTAVLDVLKELEDEYCSRGVLDKKRLKHLRRRFLRKSVKMGMSIKRRLRIENKVLSAALDEYLNIWEKNCLVTVVNNGKLTAKVLDREDLKRKREESLKKISLER